MRVLRVMRERTLGNSATQLYNTLCEQHSEAWMQRSLQYLAEFEPFLAQGVVQPNIIAPPPMLPVPRPRWLLRVYGYDVLSRLEEVKARVTSTFGSILKMDSTKKWAEEDVALLMEAKRSELEGKQRVFGLTDAEVSSRISKKELALHCRRRTRGAEETARLLEELIETFDGEKGLDTMGIPLLDHDRIQAIWLVQRRELIGVEYLYSQTGSVLQAVNLDPDAPDEAADEDLDVEDEGFEDDVDDEVEDPTIPGLVHPLAVPCCAPSLSRSDPVGSPASPHASPHASPRALTPAGSPVRDPEESYGPDGAPGYQHVQRLASSLVSLRGLACLMEQKVDELIQLWSLLPEGDKQRLTYPARHQDRLIQGRFKATKATSSVTPGTDSLKRCLLGQGSGPAQWPQTSRLVEAICIQLCRLHPSPTKSKGVRTSRWAAILGDYSKVRELVLGSPRLMEKTTLQLFELNQHTLSQWHNKRQKGQEQAVLQQGVAPPSASAVDPEPQPQQRPLLQEGMTYGHQPYVFPCPPNTAGQAKQRKRPGATAQTAVLGHSATPAPHPTSSPSTSSAAGAAAAAAAAAPPVPRTTSWRHKKRAEEEEEGGSNTGKRKYERKRAENLCSLCGQPKRKEFDHSRFGNVAFCSASSGKTVEQWLAEMRAKKK
ncbi:hypothetical protein AOXY_G25730 [Acipenser oxyrinchus oxyrinchus]|uniref:DUF6729 domain-containing protein n=1 Tax=Acipenser oxyrinchus oxyrinchus TaxID=40147 RepID=A0AAD8FXD1_ACIOX|nr:hypothetical protein AOXY_G25730 [Acipenser oxyrinchus oxyrinchus]